MIPISQPSKQRWIALGLFCALICAQSCIWNTWGPIADSVMQAFPSWHKSLVALLSNWGCITYLTCCLPCCWLLYKKGISFACNQLGMAASYLIGPAVVKTPDDYDLSQEDSSVFMTSNGKSHPPPTEGHFLTDTRTSADFDLTNLRIQIMSLMRIEADQLAFWTIVFGSLLSLAASRGIDIFQGHLKIAIYILLLISTAMFLWVLLLDNRLMVFHKNELYAAVILGVSTSWSTPALFLELASEIAFPVSEAIVGGYMIFLSNLVGAIFYFLYFVPEMGMFPFNTST
ncbi:hypothetical protein KM043_011027 [Ampulex compressa]|nr:hypothetical protein KM043_011027 [Ampulex compressa]